MYFISLKIPFNLFYDNLRTVHILRFSVSFLFQCYLFSSLSLSRFCFYSAIGYLIVSPVPPPVAIAVLIAAGRFLVAPCQWWRLSPTIV